MCCLTKVGLPKSRDGAQSGNGKVFRARGDVNFVSVPRRRQCVRVVLLQLCRVACRHFVSDVAWVLSGGMFSWEFSSTHT